MAARIAKAVGESPGAPHVRRRFSFIEVARFIDWYAAERIWLYGVGMGVYMELSRYRSVIELRLRLSEIRRWHP